MYHRVAEIKEDRQHTNVRPEHFAEHLRILNNYRAVTMSQLAEELQENKLRGNAVVVTFDDGYIDALTTVAPLMATAGMPGTLYITTDLDTENISHKQFWWDELEALYDISPWMETEVGPYMMVAQQLKLVDSKSRRERLDGWAQNAGHPGTIHEYTRRLNHSEIKSLCRFPLLEIGSHTIDHEQLSACSYEEQAHQIIESRRVLYDITGREVDSFAYPYGTISDYNQDSKRLAELAGYSSAVSNFPDVIWPGTNRYALPRLVVRDCEGPVFANWLSAWLAPN